MPLNFISGHWLNNKHWMDARNYMTPLSYIPYFYNTHAHISVCNTCHEILNSLTTGGRSLSEIKYKYEFHCQMLFEIRVKKTNGINYGGNLSEGNPSDSIVFVFSQFCITFIQHIRPSHNEKTSNTFWLLKRESRETGPLKFQYSRISHLIDVCDNAQVSLKHLIHIDKVHKIRLTSIFSYLSWTELSLEHTLRSVLRLI